MISRSSRLYYRSRFSSKPQRIDISELNMLLRGLSILGSGEYVGNGQIGIELAHGFRLLLRRYARIELLDYEHRLEELPVSVIDGGEPLKAMDIEKYIYALRQIYTLVLLLQTDRVWYISSLEDKDLEAVLNEEERLRFSSISISSFWVALNSMTRAGVKAAVTVVGMFYAEGRNSLLRQLRARTASEELDVVQKQINIEFDRAERTIDLLQRIYKIKDLELRTKILNTFRDNMALLGKPDILENPRD